jgi:hypothetical protein
MFANDEPVRFGTIIVVGGGCYGSYYVRQLRRASLAGAVRWSRVLVVDRNAECALVQSGNARPGEPSPDAVTVIVEEWTSFFKRYLDDAAEHRERSADDTIVP